MNMAYNMDCLVGMREYPDRYFDLAIVDPVYGGVTLGGYAKNKSTGVAKSKDYNTKIWEQEKTGQDYFDELFRVSKNQVIWGGELLRNQYSKRLSMLDMLGQMQAGWGWICGLRISLYIIQ